MVDLARAVVIPGEPTHPFSAVVGQGELKLALILNAIDARIGSLLVLGEKGTAKSTTVGALTAVPPKLSCTGTRPSRTSAIPRRRALDSLRPAAADGCAALDTAANMNNAAMAHLSFRDLDVVAISTGGVETNGGRAGDPASYHETGDSETGAAGTINTMLLIGREVTPGATVKAVMTATEAQAAVLQELVAVRRHIAVRAGPRRRGTQVAPGGPGSALPDRGTRQRSGAGLALSRGLPGCYSPDVRRRERAPRAEPKHRRRLHRQ